jgi:hypothetical protein
LCISIGGSLFKFRLELPIDGIFIATRDACKFSKNKTSKEISYWFMIHRTIKCAA